MNSYTACGIARSMAIVSARAQDWEDPTEFFGCGRFAADSWRIFCRGGAARLAPRDVDDPTLQRYLRWARTGSAEPRAPRPRKRRAAAATAAPVKRAAGAAAFAASGSATYDVQGEQCPHLHGACQCTPPRHTCCKCISLVAKSGSVPVQTSLGPQAGRARPGRRASYAADGVAE